MMLALAGRLRPSQGPTDADDARPCRAPQAQQCPLQALIAARTGEAPGPVVEHIGQAMSIALQRENACAVLRRMPPAEPCKGHLAER